MMQKHCDPAFYLKPLCNAHIFTNVCYIYCVLCVNCCERISMINCELVVNAKARVHSKPHLFTDTHRPIHTPVKRNTPSSFSAGV